MSLPTRPPVVKWHYVVDYVDGGTLNEMTAFFRRHGNLGLELVSYDHNSGLAVFKQPISDQWQQT